MEKISVIVPIYNVSAYLDKCIKSLIEQTYRNLEIILVDDGSTDDCGEKCEQWAKTDERIVVIHKENGGLSDARNAGLAVATGELIGFVDSDDWIDKSMYQRLYNEIERVGCDIALCCFHETETENVCIEESDIKYEFTGRELLRHMFEGNHEPYVTYSVWKCLYRRRAIDNLRFPKGRVYEDVLFTINAFWSQSHIVVLKDKLYYYRVRRNSITKRHLSQKQIDDVFEYCDGLLKYYNSNGTAEEKLYIREAILWTVLSFRYEVMIGKGQMNLAKSLSGYLHNNGIYMSCIENLSVKKLLKYWAWSGSRCRTIIYNVVSSVLRG